ncbi:MAG TPA: hypothetical protein VNM38_02940, partial [Solirubrobacterales bacterium]|nr:hypothetical protein [Solirubrobacterales bacterium]
IYGLGRSVQPLAGPPLAARPRANVAQIRDYLENLVAEEARLVVLEADGGVAEGLAPLRATGLPVADIAAGDPLGRLRRSTGSGAEYLVVPRAADEWLQDHAEVAEEIEESCRKIADQRHLCRVYELNKLREDSHMGEEA